ncbi:MAG: hypothetical protein M1823_006009 [Watsoniomyces obsoletus]|nr:MAG: hypothetical protein M1823_006009 [Watsoniomyces obsoletus]
MMLWTLAVATTVLAVPVEEEQQQQKHRLEKRLGIVAPLLSIASGFLKGGGKKEATPEPQVAARPTVDMDPCLMNKVTGSWATKAGCFTCCGGRAAFDQRLECNTNCRAMIPDIIAAPAAPSPPAPAPAVAAAPNGGTTGAQAVPPPAPAPAEPRAENYAFVNGQKNLIPMLNTVDPNKPPANANAMSGGMAPGGASQMMASNPSIQSNNNYNYPLDSTGSSSQMSTMPIDGSAPGGGTDSGSYPGDSQSWPNPSQQAEGTGVEPYNNGQYGNDPLTSQNQQSQNPSYNQNDGSSNPDYSLQNAAYNQEGQGGYQDAAAPGGDGSLPADYRLQPAGDPNNPGGPDTTQKQSEGGTVGEDGTVSAAPKPLDGTAYGGASPDASYVGLPGRPLDPTRTKPLTPEEASGAKYAQEERVAAAIVAAAQDSAAASAAAAAQASTVAKANADSAASAAAAKASTDAEAARNAALETGRKAAEEQARKDDVELQAIRACASRIDEKKMKLDPKRCGDCCKRIAYEPMRPNGIMYNKDTCNLGCIEAKQAGGKR